MEALLPPQLAAEYLHVTVRTLERWRTTGKGPVFVQLVKKVFYQEAALVEFVERSRRRSTSERAAA